MCISFSVGVVGSKHYTVPLETIRAFACSNTSSLLIMFTTQSPWWDKNHNRGKDENNQMLQLINCINVLQKRQWLTLLLFASLFNLKSPF